MAQAARSRRVWQPAERGAERCAEIHAYLHKEGWSDPLAKKDGSLEECSAPELAAMNVVAGDFSESYIGSALKIETIQQLIENENAHVDWREGFWGRPPAWLESVKFSALMGETIMKLISAKVESAAKTFYVTANRQFEPD
ncbi:MAG: hypothetical protein OXG49_12440 [Chloroflexi bacterium]|nr:hypothetical protein [Chloroflexota bacterium]